MERNQTPNNDIKNTSDLMRSHVANLNNKGIGPISMMCNETLVQTQLSNPKLIELFAEEGAKFASLARRVAPPELMAKEVEKYCKLYPPIAYLEEEGLDKVFQGIRAGAEDLAERNYQRGDNARLAHDSVINYLEFTSRQPNLFLSCAYLTFAMTYFTDNLSKQMQDALVAEQVANFGTHFNAKNMVAVLPQYIHTALVQVHGKEAGIDRIDKGVLAMAMRALHNDGRFEIRGRGVPGTETAGMTPVLQCPMEGYVFEVLVKHDALLHVISSVMRLENDMSRLTAVPKDLGSLMLAHYENCETVKASAEFILAL